MYINPVLVAHKHSRWYELETRQPIHHKHNGHRVDRRVERRCFRHFSLHPRAALDCIRRVGVVSRCRLSNEVVTRRPMTSPISDIITYTFGRLLRRGFSKWAIQQQW